MQSRIADSSGHVPLSVIAKGIVLVTAMALLLSSTRFWLAYIYSARLGLAGTEAALDETAARAERALHCAETIEGIGIALCLWLLLSMRAPLHVRSNLLRLVVCLIIAFWFTIFTFTVVHGD